MNRRPHARRREIVYLGWQGNANFGDELLYDAWKVALGRDLEITAPLTLGRYLVKSLPGYLGQLLRMRGAERLVLLGGGTTIGFGTWARHTGLARVMYRAAGVAIPGAGAAERADAFLLARQPQDWAAWRRMRNVALLGVRGPLTDLECAQEWRPTGVIGDPALIYPRFANLDRPERANTIGLCLGSEGASRFDVPTVVAAVQRVARELGATVTVFEVTAADAPVTREVVRLLGGQSRLVRFSGSVREMMQEIAACRAFVSERLHGTVAAVSLGVASTPLSYASKCDDFWMSVTGERSSIRLDHSVDDLAHTIRLSLDPARQARIDSTVAELQELLIASASILTSWLAGERSTTDLLASDFDRVRGATPRAGAL
jgi:hypothetical protein